MLLTWLSLCAWIGIIYILCVVPFKLSIQEGKVTKESVMPQWATVITGICAILLASIFGYIVGGFLLLPLRTLF